MEKTLFIADDHTMIRKGLATWFDESTEWKCCGQAASKDELIEAFNNLEKENCLPAVLITDINLNGADAVLRLLQKLKKTGLL